MSLIPKTFFFTGPLDPTIVATTSPSTTRLFTTNTSAPYFQALLSNFTKPFYHIDNVSNAAMYTFLSESIYLGSSKGVLLP